MSAKEDILNRIRQATKDVRDKDPMTDTPITWRYGRGIEMEDVVGVFVKKVEDYKATVVRVSPKEVAGAIVKGLHATGAKSVVVPVGLSEEWVKAIKADGLQCSVDEPQLTNYELDAHDAVVTAAAVAVADTGTIMLDHSADQGRRALSLVPDRHICVVRSSQVVSDVPEAVAMLKPAILAGQPSTWISGGSATSDIELSRVDGVHGPRQLYVVLVDE